MISPLIMAEIMRHSHEVWNQAHLAVSFPTVSSPNLAPAHRSTGRSQTQDSTVARAICVQGSSPHKRGGKSGKVSEDPKSGA